jgi:hypothetical protein
MKSPVDSNVAALTALERLREEFGALLNRNEERHRRLEDTRKRTQKKMDTRFLQQCYRLKPAVSPTFESALARRLGRLASQQQLNRPPKGFSSSGHALYINLPHALPTGRRSSIDRAARRKGENAGKEKNVGARAGETESPKFRSRAAEPFREWRAPLAPCIGSSFGRLAPPSVEPTPELEEMAERPLCKSSQLPACAESIAMAGDPQRQRAKAHNGSRSDKEPNPFLSQPSDDSARALVDRIKALQRRRRRHVLHRMVSGRRRAQPATLEEWHAFELDAEAARAEP